MTFSHEDEDWIARIKTLVFGLYAWLPDVAHKVDSAGSGVLIAPTLALTAKHVTRDMLRLDSRVEMANPPRGQFAPNYSTMLYQVPRWGMDVRWGVRRVWDSLDTDISLLRIESDSPAARTIEPVLPQAYFDWQLLPPPVGATVHLYGFPLPDISNEIGSHLLDVMLVHQDGVVEEVCEPIRTHGFLEFPCFRVSRPINHAFSGGAAFFEGKLVGLVSAGQSFEMSASIASLWPLALLIYRETDKTEYRVADLLDSGAIRACDWLQVKERAARRPCSEALAGTPTETRCLGDHAVLRLASDGNLGEVR